MCSNFVVTFFSNRVHIFGRKIVNIETILFLTTKNDQNTQKIRFYKQMMFIMNLILQKALQEV